MSSNPTAFLKRCLNSRLRLDNRQEFESRPLSLFYDITKTHAEVSLGDTKVVAVVTGRIVHPQKHRPSDGEIHVKLHFTSMSSPNIDSDKSKKRISEITRIVEKSIIESNSISTRSLSILATVYVWSIEINIHVINDCGCVIDAALYAAFTALINFRKPRTDIISDKLVIHPPSEVRPVPLTLLHVPISSTFALFSDPTIELLDPTEAEEQASDGHLTILCNTRKQLCGIEKLGGMSIAPAKLITLTNLAIKRATYIHSLMLKAATSPAEIEDSIKHTSESNPLESFYRKTISLPE